MKAAAQVQLLLTAAGVAALTWLLAADLFVSAASAWTSYWALAAIASAGYYEP